MPHFDFRFLSVHLIDAYRLCAGMESDEQRCVSEKEESKETDKIISKGTG